MNILTMTAAQTAAAIAAGDVTATEVTRAHLNRIDAVDGRVHAFLHVDEAGALATAARVDAGELTGPLAGVPLALKDVLATRGVPTTCGSKILDGWRPPYDATVVTRLQSAGVVVLGKTNMDEFAMGSSTENSAFGPTHNPWDLSRIPGGSSGGSAAAVAAYEAPLGIGTDTGGSIRQPAAVCGLVGVKPTYGTVSRYGLVAFSSSLDQAGPFARTVLDAALLHETIAGYDPMDSTSINAPIPDLVGACATRDLTGVRVGVVRELSGDGYEAGVQASFDAAVEVLQFAFGYASRHRVGLARATSEIAASALLGHLVGEWPASHSDYLRDSLWHLASCRADSAPSARKRLLGTPSLHPFGERYRAQVGRSGASGIPSRRQRG